MKNFKFFVIFAVCVFVPFFVSCQNKKFNLPIKEIEILTSAGNSIFVKAEVAQKEEERNYGFMNRKNIRTGKIQNIFDMTPFSLAPVKSTRSVRYALEVPQGWFEKNGIKTGDKIVLD